MRFLSFSQPWLWSITDLRQEDIDERGLGERNPADGSRRLEPKRIENRTWAPPISMIDQRFALHAAKSWDEDAIGFFMRLGIDWFPARRDQYATSAIIAVATIDRIVTEKRRVSLGQQPWLFGPYGWVLTDVVKLVEPVPMKGAQGLRELAPDVNSLVLERLAA
jgi:hypothetical protein